MSAKANPRVHGSRDMRPGTGTSRIKAGRSIRCPARIRPQRSPNRFRAQWTSGRGQPFMPRVSLEPLPFDASLPFCPCDANAAAFRRACDSAFHPATGHSSIIPIKMKNISIIWLIENREWAPLREPAMSQDWCYRARQKSACRAAASASSSGPTTSVVRWPAANTMSHGRSSVGFSSCAPVCSFKAFSVWP